MCIGMVTLTENSKFKFKNTKTVQLERQIGIITVMSTFSSKGHFLWVQGLNLKKKG